MAIKSFFCVLLLLTGFVLINTVQFGRVMAATYVSGIITADTTWTQANSPYVVTAPLLVNSSITLTIEPGVTVYISDTYMKVDGTLSARGTPTNPILLICNGTDANTGNNNDAIILFTSISTSWNELNSSGSIIENAIINSTQNDHTIYIDDVSTKINNCTIINSGRRRAIWISGEAPIISNSSITSNFAGITCGTGSNNASISDNTISGCKVGIEIYGGSPIVERNLITTNLGSKTGGNGGIRINYEGTTPIIRNNTIVGNSVGFNILDSPAPTIMLNNIQDNIEYNIHLYDGSESDINAINNWWGTTDESAINQSIRDFKNDFNLGVVTFVPFLTEPNPSAPAIPPPPEPEPEPIPSQISLLVDTSSTVVGSAVYINGKLAAMNGSALSDETITLSYSITGSEWIPIGSDITNATGDYNIQWINTASGTFTLKVEWTGNDDYLGASATTTLSFLPYQNQKNFFVESNSTVSALTFNNTNAELTFTVSGASGTTGYVTATIPKDLLYAEGNWLVLVNEQPVTPIVNEDANNTYLYFTYGHSTKTIEIKGTYAIPEFPLWVILPLFLIVVIPVIIYIKKLKQK